MFHGSSFIYNEIPSEMYDLRILNFDASGTGQSPAIGSTTLIQKWIQSKKRPYHFGTANTTPLTFTLTIGSFDPRTTIDRSRIGRWLLGKTQYKKLQIATDDFIDVYFNVIFSDGGNFYNGNIYQGVELNAVCDAPWAWTFPRTDITDNNRAFTFTGLSQSEEINVDNDKKIITSSYDELRLGDFNKNWFRFLPGNNQLNITGYLDNFYIQKFFC